MLTDDDKDKLKSLAENGTANSLSNHHNKIDSIVVDPVELPVRHQKRTNKINEHISSSIKEEAEEKSYSEIAEEYGIHKNTVYLHVNGLSGTSGRSQVHPELCAVMREMAHDGISMIQIGERFDLAPKTVQYHVSSTKHRCECEHNIPRKTYE